MTCLATVAVVEVEALATVAVVEVEALATVALPEIGRASCRERV